jgi:hypothetical protein
MPEVPGLVLTLARSERLCFTLHRHRFLSDLPGGATNSAQNSFGHVLLAFALLRGSCLR